MAALSSSSREVVASLSRSDSPPPSDFPPGARVTKLVDTLEIKQRWLRSEWAPECQFSKYIRPHFSDRRELSPTREGADIEKITTVFHNVRGRWSLWQEPREKAKWTKVETDLSLEWADRNVAILYPSPDRFPVSELDGIVLWDEGPFAGPKRYRLHEGNHRFSTWLATRIPPEPSCCNFYR